MRCVACGEEFDYRRRDFVCDECRPKLGRRMRTAAQFIAQGEAVTKILKARFPNLTMEDTFDLAADIITVLEELE